MENAFMVAVTIGFLFLFEVLREIRNELRSIYNLLLETKKQYLQGL